MKSPTINVWSANETQKIIMILKYPHNIYRMVTYDLKLNIWKKDNF